VARLAQTEGTIYTIIIIVVVFKCWMKNWNNSRYLQRTVVAVGTYIITIKAKAYCHIINIIYIGTWWLICYDNQDEHFFYCVGNLPSTLCVHCSYIIFTVNMYKNWFFLYLPVDWDFYQKKLYNRYRYVVYCNTSWTFLFPHYR